MGLELTQKQNQILTQKMQYSLKLLQMCTPDLLLHMQGAAQENPLLELTVLAPSEDVQRRLRKLEWLERTDEASFSWPDRISNQAPRELHAFSPNHGATLEEALLFQLPGFRLPPAQERAVCKLIGALDENGYLRAPPGGLAAELQLSSREIDAALGILQRMEPAGVGARSLQECLLIQARRQAAPPALIALISHHLNLLAENKLDKLAMVLGVDLEEVKSLRQRLLAFNPKPGNGFATRQTVQYIRPDLFIVRYESGFAAIYNEYDLPAATINGFYQSMQHESPETDAYIREHLKKAELLISALQHRRETIHACAKAILARQAAFFQLGPGNLQPMTLRDVAEDMAVHPSTISRAVNEKYLQCQWGIFALEDFFARSLGRQADAASSDMAITQLRQIIQAENPRKPFSDQAIADLLNRQGISISRRTVAKYRDAEGIPPASRRKQY